jgi:ribose 5-phosphate isomerase RpiB
MKIAIINETSAADKNADILKALEGRNLELLNVGMTKSGSTPELLYIHTGLMSAMLLYAKRVDFVIGGCGTGQGYLNAVMQYPGVFCGHILTPLDAWLFMQINAGNCISLALNQGYGWAGDVNLKMIFDQLFSVEKGCGYPPIRKEPQRIARMTLEKITVITHRSFAEIVENLPDDVLIPVLKFPKFLDSLNLDSISDISFKNAILKRLH